jgi:hypothetical protein
MLTAKVNFLTAHCCIIGALMPDRQSQIRYRRVNAPIVGRSLQFGRASAPIAPQAVHTMRGGGINDASARARTSDIMLIIAANHPVEPDAK